MPYIVSSALNWGCFDWLMNGIRISIPGNVVRVVRRKEMEGRGEKRE